MAVYVLLYLMAAGLMIISILYSNAKLNKYFALGLLVVMTIIAGLRFDVGLDYASYLELARSYHQYGESSWEYGYQVFLSVLPFFGLTDQSLFMFMAMLTSLFIYLFTSYHSKNILLSVFFFLTLPPLYLSSLNISRQFVAVAIFAYSLRFIATRDIIKYIACILLAFLFHKTAILLIPLYFLLGRAPSVMYYIAIGGVYLLLLPFIEIFTNIAGISGSYLILTDEVEAISQKTFVYFAMAIVLISRAEKLQRIDSSSVVLVNVTFLMALLSITPGFISIPTEIFWRVLFYFFLVFPILIVNLAGTISSPPLRAIYTFGAVAGATLYYFYTVIERGVFFNLVPYSVNLNILDIF